MKQNKYIFHTNYLSNEQVDLIFERLGSPVERQDGLYLASSTNDIDLSWLRNKFDIDINVLKEPFVGQCVRLLITDMDSTLISIECIDEIADMLGIKHQVSVITEAAMRGELDFEQSLTQRVALLKGLPVDELQRVYDERLNLNPGAEKLISHLKQSNIKSALVSGGFTFFTDQLKDRLGLDYTLANTLGIEDGRLTGVVNGDIIGAQSKADLLIKLSKELNLEPCEVIAIGDGANDLLMLGNAGLSVAYHAKPIVQAQTDIQINHNGLDAVVDLLKV